MKLSRVSKKLLEQFGLSIIRLSTLRQFINTSQEHKQLLSTVNFLSYINPDEIKKILHFSSDLKAQFHQDLFVLLTLEFKTNGFFVDFGATNGIQMSNSWSLEKFGWRGIVAEPGRQWQEALKNNRECYISTKCVWKESNKKILFNETIDSGFSTIDLFSSGDRHSRARTSGQKYYVETISLADLLLTANAPKHIDYLSIDTEGSEFDILSAFDFKEWDISIITVEHNFTENREKLRLLLESNGFVRVLTSISEVDDWYVKPSLLEQVKTNFSVEVV
jgi:FkbM family methyltransferase